MVEAESKFEFAKMFLSFSESGSDLWNENRGYVSSVIFLKAVTEPFTCYSPKINSMLTSAAIDITIFLN